MPDTVPLVRQWRLLRLLSVRQQGLTVRELAGEMSVCEKTIRRDLQLFRRVGFPLEEAAGEGGFKQWRISATWSENQLGFAFDEALALYLGRKFLESLAGTMLWDAAQRAFQKIRASLTARALKYVERMGGAFYATHGGAGDYSRKAAIIDELQRGIEDRQVVFLTYRSQQASEATTYDVHPYGLAFHRGSLYLVGLAPQHNAVRHWKVDRIEAARVDVMRFQRPADFDLARHFAGSFGVYQGQTPVCVVVRFQPSVVRYVQESKWHDSQRLRPQADGTLVAEFQLSATEEIKHWVYSFGPDAEVVEPESLRAEMMDELQQTLARYSHREGSGGHKTRHRRERTARHRTR